MDDLFDQLMQHPRDFLGPFLTFIFFFLIISAIFYGLLFPSILPDKKTDNENED